MSIITIPKNCPCCEYTLELVNEQLFCRNIECPAQVLKKLEHFCKALTIKGMGPKTLEKLNLSDITELYYLERGEVIAALGSSKVADKLLDEIARSKGAGLDVVLTSFSIPLVGETASKKIAAKVSHIREITPEKCKEAGLGDKVTNNLICWLEDEFPDLEEFLPFTFKSSISGTNNAGPIICITGKLISVKNKAEATRLLVEAGYSVTDTLTKTTKYLLDEQNNGSSKRKKAEEYGICVISNLNQFLKET